MLQVPGVSFKQFKKKYTFEYSTHLLLANYTHIGFKKSLTLHTFRKALFGFYSNVAIINPSLTLAQLRYSLNLLFALILQNRKVCFAFFGFPNGILPRIYFKNQYYFFNCWISGYLTNNRFAKKASPVKVRFCPSIPSAVVTYGFEPQVAVDIAREANKKRIPSVSFADSHTNPGVFSYWVPINSKSGYTKLFFINFVNSLIYKSYVIKKGFFFDRGLKLAEHFCPPSLDWWQYSNVRRIMKGVKESLKDQRSQRYDNFYEKLDSQFRGFHRKAAMEETKNARKRQKFFRGRFSARLFGGPKWWKKKEYQQSVSKRFKRFNDFNKNRFRVNIVEESPKESLFDQYSRMRSICAQACKTYIPVFTRGAKEGATYDQIQKITRLRKTALSSKLLSLRNQAIRDRVVLVREKAHGELSRGPLVDYHKNCKVLEKLFKKKNPKKYESIIKKIEEERKLKLKFKKLVPDVGSAPRQKKNLPFWRTRESYSKKVVSLMKKQLLELHQKFKKRSRRKSKFQKSQRRWR